MQSRLFPSFGEQGLLSSGGEQTSPGGRAHALSRGPLVVAVPGPWSALNSCGTWAYLLQGLWDLPRPGIEPVSPALGGRHRFHLWVRKIPWRREWLPTPICPPGEFRGHWSLVSFSPWNRKQQDMTEQLTFSHIFLLWQADSLPLSLLGSAESEFLNS